MKKKIVLLLSMLHQYLLDYNLTRQTLITSRGKPDIACVTVQLLN